MRRYYFSKELKYFIAKCTEIREDLDPFRYGSRLEVGTYYLVTYSALCQPSLMKRNTKLYPWLHRLGLNTVLHAIHYIHCNYVILVYNSEMYVWLCRYYII